jgi:hypothetical protein
MDSGSPAFTELPHTQHFTRNASLTLLLGSRTQQSHSRHSHRARLVLILDFGFWATCAAARRNDPHYLLSAAHVNQKSSDMTTPNDTRSRHSSLIPRVSFACRANDDRVRRANSNCNRENKCWLANHVAAANGSPQ